MPEQTYRVWLTSNKAVVVNGEELRQLIAKKVVVTVAGVGMKQPINNPPGKPRMKPPAPPARKVLSNRFAGANGVPDDVAGRKRFR